MKISTNHTTEIWFPNTTFREYFESSFKRNTIGTLKVQESIARNWTEETIDKLWDGIAQIFIDAIVKNKYGVLSVAPFPLLPEKEKERLREIVCEAVQHNAWNKSFWQKINASNIGMGGLQINQDTTPWLISQDMIGSIGWNMLSIALVGIKWATESYIYRTTASGNRVEILSKTDFDNVAEAVFD